MTPLREAAQALVTFVDDGGAVPDAARIFADLRAALTRPDPDRWAEGAEAMREAAIQRAEAEEECPGDIPDSLRQKTLRNPAAALRAAVRSTKIGIVDGIRALPVPPATTRAPEAKTAESAALRSPPAPASKIECPRCLHGFVPEPAPVPPTEDEGARLLTVPSGTECSGCGSVFNHGARCRKGRER